VHIQTVLFGNAKGFMHYAGIHFFYSLVATKILNRQLFLYDNVTLRCALSIHLTDEPNFSREPYKMTRRIVVSQKILHILHFCC
jgi:hypothetical protein